MSNRRQLARERLEIYLVHLILMYRRLILIVGLVLLVCAIATMFVNHTIGYVTLIPAIYLLLLGNSCDAVLYTTRLGAWYQQPDPTQAACFPGCYLVSGEN